MLDSTDRLYLARQIRTPLVMAQWERAKGELQALVALQGSYDGGGDAAKYEELKPLVEKFIQDVEDNGYAE
jgi:hypothetical protein